MSNTHLRGGHDYGVRHFNANQSDSLESLVAGVLAHEEAALSDALSAQALILIGAVYVEGDRIQNPDALIRQGSLIRLHTQPRRYPPLANVRSRIARQTAEYLIIDKPAGLPVHAMVDNAKENLLSYLETQLGRKTYITHRLDIETSGMLLVALSPEAQSSLNKQLAAKKIKRHYFAFTQAVVAPGKYVHYMEESPRAPKIMHDSEVAGRLRCELTVASCRPVSREELSKRWEIESLGDSPIYLLEIELGTGRTQQIRAQLSHMGASIIGDQLYKNENCLIDRLTLRRAIGLRAETLTLPRPLI